MLSVLDSMIYDDKNIWMCDDIRMPSLYDLITMGDLLRILRERKGLKIKDIVRESKLNKMTISKIESNRGGFEPETIRKIAAVIGIRVSDLYSYLESPKTMSNAASSLCPEENPNHVRLQQHIEALLHDGMPIGAVEYGISALSEAWHPGSAPMERKQFSPDDLPDIGDSVKFPGGKKRRVGERSHR